MRHREKTMKYREKNIKYIWDMIKRFYYYDYQWSARRSRNVAGDIFEETLAKNFPKQKTLSHRIKKLYNSEAS